MRKCISQAAAMMLLAAPFFAATSAAQAVSRGPALEGYCAVCIAEARQWMKGDPAHSVEYDGQDYWFPSEDQKQMFLADPAKYTPALGGDCTVCFDKMKKRVPGDVRFGTFYRDRLFLFPSDKERAMFKKNPAHFAKTDLALGGGCAVCLIEGGQHVPGDARFTAHYRGFRYLFPSEKERAMFLANPAKYADRELGDSQAAAGAVKANLVAFEGKSGCAACEHGVHPIGASDTLGLAVTTEEGAIYVVEDADRLYPDVYENRFAGLHLKVDGEVLRREGKFVWVQPNGLEAIQ